MFALSGRDSERNPGGNGRDTAATTRLPSHKRVPSLWLCTSAGETTRNTSRAILGGPKFDREQWDCRRERSRAIPKSNHASFSPPISSSDALRLVFSLFRAPLSSDIARYRSGPFPSSRTRFERKMDSYRPEIDLSSVKEESRREEVVRRGTFSIYFSYSVARVYAVDNADER